MKKIYLALMCVAGMVMTSACGNKEANKATEADKDATATEQQAETAPAENENEIMKVDKVLFSQWGITTDQLEPDFEYLPVLKGFDKFSTNGANVASVVFQKSDGSAISEEEFMAYADKIYKLGQKLSQDGKVVRGFTGMTSDETREGAMKEVKLEDCVVYGSGTITYLKDDTFQSMYLFYNDRREPNYLGVKCAPGLQGAVK